MMSSKNMYSKKCHQSERLSNTMTMPRDYMEGSMVSLLAASSQQSCDSYSHNDSHYLLYDENGNNLQDSKTLPIKGNCSSLQAITEEGIKEVVSEYHQKKWKYDEILEVDMSSILRYQLRSTFLTTHTIEKTKPYHGKCQDSSSGNVATCESCTGKGYVNCDECIGAGVISCGCYGAGEECDDCGDSGILLCDECDGKMTFSCEDCDETGHILCYEEEEKKKKTKIHDAYSQNIDHFPESFLTSCIGETMLERTPSNGAMSPLSSDDCLNEKMIKASKDFLKLHNRCNQSNCCLIKQKDRICVLPVFKITYKKKEKVKFLWIVGTNRKVYDPFFKPSCCKIC